MRGFARFAAFALIFGLGVALWRDTYYNGWDFSVYWRAIRAMLYGRSPYLEGAGTIWVYKYPPWTLAWLAPLGLIPESAAKAVWGAVGLLSLAAVAAWLRSEARLSWRAIYWGSLPFWFLFAYHALAGQVVLPLLAVALWASSRFSPFFLLAAWTWKLTTAWALFAYAPGRAAWRGLAVFIAASAIGTWLCAHWSGVAVVDLLQAWAGAATSGAEGSSGDGFLGWRNQGLPAAIARVLGGESVGPFYLGISLFCAIALAWLGQRLTRGLPGPPRIAIWAGLCAVVQPLGWYHGFVLAWPLAVLLLARAWVRRSPDRWIAIVSVALTTVVTSGSLGLVGAWAEVVSVKSIGVLISAFLLARIERGTPAC